jgi:hypothetical protein
MRCIAEYRPVLLAAACACAALACNLGLVGPAPTSVPAAAVPTATEAAMAASPTQAATETAGPTATLEVTATMEATATASGPLKGTVLQRSNCRYGPGAFYLYKIGMREGAPIDVVGRTIDGRWAYIKFTGTTNLCWINSKLIQVNGDLMGLPDAYNDSSSLPIGGKYGAVAILSVSGDTLVTVEWSPIVLPEIALPGDAGTQYVLEVWTCINGSPGFYSQGSDVTEITFEVDDSCGVTSRANIVAQNKLGVSGITPIPIP